MRRIRSRPWPGTHWQPAELVARRAVTALVTVVGLVLAIPAYSTPGFADPQDDREKIDRELAKARSTLESATERAQEAAVAHLDASRRLPAARERLAEARGLVAAAEVAANRARRQADEANRRLRAADRAYRAAEEQVTVARKQVGEFVSAAYKGSGAVAFTSLVTAESPADLADRLAYLDDLASDQRAALDRVIELRYVAKRKQNAAILALRRADQAKQDAEDALAAARAARDAAVRAEASVLDLIDQRESALRTAEGERAASLERYRELRRENSRVEAEVQALADRDSRDSRAVAGSTGQFVMPAHGWKSSDFGQRWDPYYRVWQLHTGMDIAAPGGSPVRAAAAGRVFRAGWNGGYGQYTCLYHGLIDGSGLATCYAHQSQISVFPGQEVRRGEVIGSVGTTGASTGHHLHFEVRVDGVPVNPVRWLPACLC